MVLIRNISGFTHFKKFLTTRHGVKGRATAGGEQSWEELSENLLNDGSPGHISPDY
jgi:hypothetical protein